jgi:hypothetical protein
MAASTTLLQFLLMLVAGWLQWQQAATIDYLRAENRIVLRKYSISAGLTPQCGFRRAVA